MTTIRRFAILLCALGAHVLIASYRCEDIGINKWWALVMLVPLVNVFGLFYFLLRRGNAYYMHVKSKEAGNE